MVASYLIRMDDACPTMSGERWTRLERLLDRYKICPVVAVVPDNQDPELMKEASDPHFWDRVRGWQSKGWTVAMHGETHLMRATAAPQILPFYARSEFSGLSLAQQCQKLQRAQAVFDKERIEIATWIAPAHCFDWTTLEALRMCTSVSTISDGIAIQSYFEQGFHWVPQQLWGFRKMPFGLWTVCLHPNTMGEQEFRQIESDLEKYSRQILDFSEVHRVQRRRNWMDRAANALFWIRRHQYKAGLR